MSNPSVEAKASLEPQVDKYQAFHDSLDVTQFKTELGSLRQVENPDPEQIAQKERDIVGIIKKEMQGFKLCGPAITEFLLQELDIQYLKLEDSHQRPETLVIVTADNTLQRLDNEEFLTNENVRNQNISNILALTKRSKPKGLVFWVGEDMKKISNYKELTLKSLKTIADILKEEDCKEECIKVCRKLNKKSSKKDDYYHFILGHLLNSTERYEEATNLAYQAIESNPEYPGFYPILGESLSNKPDIPFLKQAIWAFEQFIEKANNTKGEKKEYWMGHISHVQNQINEAKNKLTLINLSENELQRRKTEIEKLIQRTKK